MPKDELLRRLDEIRTLGYAVSDSPISGCVG
jgi:hypothetical protein